MQTIILITIIVCFIITWISIGVSKVEDTGICDMKVSHLQMEHAREVSNLRRDLSLTQSNLAQARIDSLRYREELAVSETRLKHYIFENTKITKPLDININISKEGKTDEKVKKHIDEFIFMFGGETKNLLDKFSKKI